MEQAVLATPPHQPKFVRWALLLGIVVILNIFFTVILSLVYPSPRYEDFCPVQPMITPSDSVTCNAQGGIWTGNLSTPTPKQEIKAVPLDTVATHSGYCDMYAKCQKPFQTANDQHALYAFVLMIGLGIVALLAGLMPTGSSIVSSGLSYGGVLSLIIGSVQYWGNAGNWIRLAISTAGLVALLYIGWRRFRD